MNTFRKLIGIFFAAAFALVSGATLAGEKQYILTVTSSTATPAPAFTFKFTNDGNSSFNALTLSLPSGWTLSQAGGATSSRGTASVNAARNVVSVENINLPTGSGQFMTVTVTGVTGTVCAGQSGDWTAQPWTGSAVGSGQKFNPKPGSVYPVSTTVPATCFTVTPSSSDPTKGSISPSTPQTVNGGATRQFTLAPVLGYHPTTPSGTCPAGTLTGNSYTTGAIVADCTVIANFAIDTFTVSTSFDATKGSISPTSRTGVAYNTTTTFDVAPLPGFHTTSVSGCGVGAPTGTTYTTAAITAACTVSATFAANTLSFTEPTSASIAPPPLSVAVTYNGPPPASVTLAWNCIPASGSGSQTVTAPTSSPVNFSVAFTKNGTCTLTASAPNYTSFTSAAFPVYTGDLGCDSTNRKGGTLNPSALVTYVKKDDQGKWGLIRGNNKEVTDPICAVVPYVFDLDVMNTPQTSKFIVPDFSITGQKVSVKYTVVWGRFDVVGDASNIWASKRPKVSWGIASPVAGTNDFVPALPCVLDPDNPDLASTYPNGFASVSTADMDKLLPKIPDLPPFSDLYNASTCANCIKGNPNYPQYQPGQKAKMCIAQQGWTATGSDATDPLDVSVDPATVQIWTSVIDQGDGYMNLE